MTPKHLLMTTIGHVGPKSGGPESGTGAGQVRFIEIRVRPVYQLAVPILDTAEALKAAGAAMNCVTATTGAWVRSGGLLIIRAAAGVVAAGGSTVSAAASTPAAVPPPPPSWIDAFLYMAESALPIGFNFE